MGRPGKFWLMTSRRRPAERCTGPHAGYRGSEDGTMTMRKAGTGRWRIRPQHFAGGPPRRRCCRRRP
jgi:hypothetical protein